MTASAASPSKKPAVLPRLREDLALTQGAAAGGRAAWLIYDPLRHKYTQLDQPSFIILSLWKECTTAGELIEAAGQKHGLWIDSGEIAKFGSFLEQHQLTEAAAAGGWKDLDERSKARRHGPVMWLIHNYLFLKIPLFAPEPFLSATASIAEVFYDRRIQWFIAALGLLGLYLVSREWDAFILEARGLASLSGIASMAAVLFVVKGFHELGHAYTALRYGCRVPSMGLAVMMLAPMLYTDVTDAWFLQDRKKRLAIDAAGVCVELGLACIATLFWVFLPDGTLRHVAFLVATTSWILSLAVNLNPFMKFDGYYMLADMLRLDNLMPRSFEFGVWHLREMLFGLKAPAPEILPANQRRIMIGYAYAVWIYRFILFTGIALLVYTYFFKALGIALFLFEIGYFIAKPIAGELMEWWKLRDRIAASRRFRVSIGLSAAAMAIMLVPWSSRFAVPAMLEGDQIVRIFPPRPARVAEIGVKPGDRVAAGQVLVRLDAPDLVQKERIAQSKLAAVNVRLNRLAADGEDLSERQVLDGERAAFTVELKGIAREQAELAIKAPAAGTIAELNLDLRVGQWTSPKTPIALLDASRAMRAAGYVSEHDIWRIAPGAVGRFVPEVPLAGEISVTLTEVGASAAPDIAIPELVAQNGGSIEAYPDPQQRLIPVVAQYHLTLRPAGSVAPFPTAMRGTVYLDGRSESLARGIWRRVLKVLVRESGV